MFCNIYFSIIKMTLAIMDYQQYNLGPLCKLRDWIPIETLDFDKLSTNLNAISILEKNIKKINLTKVSSIAFQRSIME